MPIDGASEQSYVPVEADLGAALSVTLTATAAGFQPAISTTPPRTVVAPLVTTGLTLAGVPKVGVASVADAGTWNAPDVSLTYHWRRDYQRVEGATAATYTPVAADVGHAIEFEIEASAPGYESRTLTSRVARVVDDVVLTNQISVDGFATVDATLTVGGLGTWYPNPDFSYQWLQDGLDIPGATSSSYTVSAADLGAQISVRVVGASDGLDASAVTSPATDAVRAAFSHVASPVIHGTAEWGSKLTASLPGWTPTPRQVTYAWFVGANPVLGDSTSTFTPTADDIGQVVTVSAVGQTENSGETQSPLSAPTKPVGPRRITLSKITIPPVHLNRVVHPKGAVVPSGTPLSWQWYRGSKAIAGATSKSYLPVEADWHHHLHVTVSLDDPAYVRSRTISNSELVTNGHLTAGVVVFQDQTAVVRVGSKVRAIAVGWGPQEATVRFVWTVSRNHDVEVVSRSSSYTPVSADLGHNLRLTGFASAPHLGSMRSPVGMSSIVSAGIFTIKPIPMISGTVVVGARVTAVVGTWEPTKGVSFTYQWLRQQDAVAPAVAIAGATSPTYVLDAASAGQLVSVRVTAHRKSFRPASETSLATAAVAP